MALRKEFVNFADLKNWEIGGLGNFGFNFPISKFKISK